MINIVSVLFILFVHFLADFVFQTREMGVKKSKSTYWLTTHVVTYTLVTTLFWAFFFSVRNVDTLITIASLTFASHWLTDYVTSKVSSYMYTKKQFYFFFMTIGFDQWAHALTLFYTYNFVFNGTTV